jgi:hypothetical protein
MSQVEKDEAGGKKPGINRLHVLSMREPELLSKDEGGWVGVDMPSTPVRCTGGCSRDDIWSAISAVIEMLLVKRRNFSRAGFDGGDGRCKAGG